jgi:hypothetical protein
VKIYPFLLICSLLFAICDKLLSVEVYIYFITVTIKIGFSFTKGAEDVFGSNLVRAFLRKDE